MPSRYIAGSPAVVITHVQDVQDSGNARAGQDDDNAMRLRAPSGKVRSTPVGMVENFERERIHILYATICSAYEMVVIKA